MESTCGDCKWGCSINQLLPLGHEYWQLGERSRGYLEVWPNLGEIMWRGKWKVQRRLECKQSQISWCEPDWRPIIFSSSNHTELECLNQHDLMAMSTETHTYTAADQTPTNQRQLSDTVLPHTGWPPQLSPKLQLFMSASLASPFLGATWTQSPINQKVFKESRRVKQPHLTFLSLVSYREQNKGGRFSIHLLSFYTKKEGKK